tara:strand:+ start:2597 stop:3031 length:435 start_codon:yes stop_codon:yes gene_type:complete
MLGLIYFLWRKNNNDFLNENLLIFLTIFSVISFLFGLALHFKVFEKFEKGSRRDGIVKWYNSNKGFGFIEQDQGEDIFVHQSEIRQTGFRYLNLGDRVEFEIGIGKKGPVALRVVRTKIAETDDISYSTEEPEEYPINESPETN